MIGLRLYFQMRFRGRALYLRPTEFIFLLLISTSFATGSFAEDRSEIIEIRQYWAECQKLQSDLKMPWNGWHNNLGDGYGDWFEFRKSNATDTLGVSVLQVTNVLDAMVKQVDTSCFRPAGTIAFLLSEKYILYGQNITNVKKEVRLYFSKTGAAIQTLHRYTRAGKVMDGEPGGSYAAAASRCCEIELHRDINRAQLHLTSVLGDHYGSQEYKYEAEFVSEDGQIEPANH